MMGIGDEVMATGFARGAAEQGKKIAFGDGKRIIWGPFCEEAFRNNPNIARSLTDKGLEWCHYYKGNRTYNKLGNGRWIWNYDFRPVKGQFYFDNAELSFSIRRHLSVLIEPNVPNKPVAPNKDWGFEKYQRLVEMFRLHGFSVFQFEHGPKRLTGVTFIPVQNYRRAAASLIGIDIVVTPEGGLHHAAAAIGTPAVVLFGGFIPPQVTGYDGQQCLTGGAEACGSLRTCDHCRAAMKRITVEEVFHCAMELHREKQRV